MKDSITKSYRVDYAAHNSAYKRNQEQGLPGWNSAADLEVHITQLTGIFSREDIPKSGLVLDLGCGAGNISFWLESLGYYVTGIDVSTVAIEWAIKQSGLSNSKVNFFVINAAQNKYSTEHQFDIVLDNNCLHCIIGKDRQIYLKNVHNNLKIRTIRYFLFEFCRAYRGKR